MLVNLDTLISNWRTFKHLFYLDTRIVKVFESLFEETSPARWNATLTVNNEEPNELEIGLDSRAKTIDALLEDILKASALLLEENFGVQILQGYVPEEVPCIFKFDFEVNGDYLSFNIAIGKTTRNMSFKDIKGSWWKEKAPIIDCNEPTWEPLNAEEIRKQERNLQKDEDQRRLKASGRYETLTALAVERQTSLHLGRHRRPDAIIIDGNGECEVNDPTATKVIWIGKEGWKNIRNLLWEDEVEPSDSFEIGPTQGNAPAFSADSLFTRWGIWDVQRQHHTGYGMRTKLLRLANDGSVTVILETVNTPWPVLEAIYKHCEDEFASDHNANWDFIVDRAIKAVIRPKLSKAETSDFLKPDGYSFKWPVEGTIAHCLPDHWDALTQTLGIP